MRRVLVLLTPLAANLRKGRLWLAWDKSLVKDNFEGDLGHVIE